MNLRSNGDGPRTQLKRRCRAALLWLTLLLMVGSLGAAPRKAPSSLDRPGAVVRFTHLHERVASCKALADSHACVEQRAPAVAAADLALIPAPSELVSQPEPQREPVNIALPSKPGSSMLEIRVAGGNWLMSWVDQRVLLHVDPQRDFTVRLKTVSGACSIEQDQCRRHDDAISRTVVVPPEFLGSH